MYPSKQPGERDDRDDTPPGSPYSYSWPDGAPYAMSREEIEFCGRFKDLETIPNDVMQDIASRTSFRSTTEKFKVCKFHTILRTTEKAWLVQLDTSGSRAWFPKSLCIITGKRISGPDSFMRKKLRELSPGMRVTIGAELERCPYCGSDISCDCATPGHRPKTTLLPPRPENLDAEIAKYKLRKFIEENK